ncbi:hypothetical protein [Aquitalea sp.]|uniref:hypothetical protein n=1 Tax=Aquitalea sp. TaxID=1872623 RepID=UPI002585D50B|nr:hypothetical protein [Aquitalea sp.]
MTLQEFFNRYSQAYSALDARAVYAMFTRPFTAVHHGQIATFGSNETEALYQATVGILEYYRAQGVSSASCRITDVLPFGSELATVKVRWTAQRQQAEPWIFSTAYHLIRENGAWRIYGLAQFEEHGHPAQ